MLFVCLQGYIVMNDSWYLLFDWNKHDILRRKGRLVMFVSRHCRDITWITCWPSSFNVRLAWLFPIKWRSKRWFCVVSIDGTYQPWHTRRSLSPCGPYLATSNILPNNKVDTRYNGQCYEKEPFATSGEQIEQIDKEIHMTTSSCEWKQEWLGGRMRQSVGSMAQLTI